MRRGNSKPVGEVTLLPDPSNVVRIVKPDEVEAAKREARSQFERVVELAPIKPHPDDLEKWYA